LKVDVEIPNQTEAKRDYSVKRQRRQTAMDRFLNSISGGKPVQIGSKTFMDVNDKEDTRNGGKLRHFWKYARKACQHLGGDLPSDLSYKEVDLLFAAFGVEGKERKPKGVPFWVGAKAPEGEDVDDQWRWVSGNPLSPNYKKWRNTEYDESLYYSHGNEPKSRKHAESCAVMRYDGDERGGDGPSLATWDCCCGVMMNVVCQMKQTSHLE